MAPASQRIRRPLSVWRSTATDSDVIHGFKSHDVIDTRVDFLLCFFLGLELRLTLFLFTYFMLLSLIFPVWPLLENSWSFLTHSYRTHRNRLQAQLARVLLFPSFFCGDLHDKLVTSALLNSKNESIMLNCLPLHQEIRRVKDCFWECEDLCSIAFHDSTANLSAGG